MRTKHDLESYYIAELRTERLDAIKTYLWLAGLSRCARPLHRQQLLGRKILITEDPNEHLVWHEARIFVKPLPVFMFDLDCWAQRFCTTKEVHGSACGFMLSYAWLVRHPSDLRIAHETGLLPEAIDWATWTDFIDDFLAHVDLDGLSGISPRFQYGELRLSRLNKIYRLTRWRWDDIVQGYMTASTWYQDFFVRNFSWLIALFAFMSVVLSAMQVLVGISRGGQAFEDASYGFSVTSLVLAAVSALAVTFCWIALFVLHVVRAWVNDRRVMNQRQIHAQIDRH